MIHLSDLITDLKIKELISNDIASRLSERFSGLTLDLMKNHLLNKDKNPHGRRHNDGANKFALTCLLT